MEEPILGCLEADVRQLAPPRRALLGGSASSRLGRVAWSKESRQQHRMLLLRFNFLKSLNDKSATVLVVGAGFIGVEWATEIQHFFPRVPLGIQRSHG